MDKGLFIDVVMINLRKAFDVVDHKLLLTKLQLFGLNNDFLKWFQSYLSGRYQGYVLTVNYLNRSVFTPSILGPALYK